MMPTIIEGDNSMRSIILGGLLAAAFAATPALATEQIGGWEGRTFVVSAAFGGLFQDVSENPDDTSDLGFDAKLKIGAQIAPTWAGHLELAIGRAEFDVAGDDLELERFSAFAMGQYRAPIAGFVRPYAEAGIGFVQFDPEDGDSAEGVGFKGGLGADFALAPQASMFFEGHYAYYPEVDDDVDIGEVTFGVGVSYRFK